MLLRRDIKLFPSHPSLVPLVAKEDYVSKLTGPFPAECGAYSKIAAKRVLYQDFGEMMFTHFGVTGPLILSASAQIGKKLRKGAFGGFPGSEAGA